MKKLHHEDMKSTCLPLNTQNARKRDELLVCKSLTPFFEIMHLILWVMAKLMSKLRQDFFV